MITRRRFAAIAAASTLTPALAGRAAFAQAWPTRVVHFIVPFPAGVAPDVGCRMLAARLSEMWAHATQIFASTVGAHLICSEGEPDHVRSVPVRGGLPRGSGVG